MTDVREIRPNCDAVSAQVAVTVMCNRAAVRSNGTPAFAPAFAAAPLRRGYEIQFGGESAFARCASFGETDFARRILAWLGRQRRPRRSSAKPSEVWLGRRDSNPDNHVQRGSGRVGRSRKI